MSLTKNDIDLNEEISGWGNYPKIKAIKRKPKSIEEIKKYIKINSSIGKEMEDLMEIMQSIRIILLTCLVLIDFYILTKKMAY